MTQCTYGTRPKSGAAAYVWVTWEAFVTWLATHYSRLGTLAQIWFSDAPLDVTTFCASEIVTPSFPSIPQWIGYFNWSPDDVVTVSNYLTALYRQTVWDTVCECSPATGGTCSLTWPSSHTFPINNAGSGTAIEEGQRFTPQVAATFYGVDIWFVTTPPGNLATITLWDTVTNAVVSTQNFFSAVAGYQRLLFTTPYTLVSGREYMVSYCKPSTMSGYLENASPGDNAIVHYAQMRYAVVCGQRPNTDQANWQAIVPLVCTGGGPGGVGPPYAPDAPGDPTAIPDNPSAACSTTADLCKQITNAISLTATVGRGVNWLQSTTAPTCWVPLTPVTGLTGTGTLAVSDIVGVYVAASVPIRWGRTAETPPRYIPEFGAIQFQTDDAPTKRVGLHYASENLIDVAPFTNSIRYNARQGVTLSITPLGRCK